MSFYFFKLNLTWATLNLYKGKKDLLLKNVIPDNLSLLYDIEKSKKFYRYKINLPDLIDEQFYTDFSHLEELTNDLEEMYFKVLMNYREDGNINYDKVFLSMNDTCKQVRGYFQKKYSFLKEGLNVISDKHVEDKFNLSFDNHVGTGITHIRNFYKLKEYIEILEKRGMFDEATLNIYYDCDTENIVVESEDEETAVSLIKKIEQEMNASKEFVSNLGKININPIYEKLVAKKEFNKIEYTLVYPNGKASTERNMAILEGSRAKKQNVKLIGDENSSLDIDFILCELNKQATKGYLEKVDESIIKKCIKFTHEFLF